MQHRIPDTFSGTIILLAIVLFLDACTDSMKESAIDAPSAITQLHAESIRTFLESPGVSIIEFGGKRCRPCMEMRGILEKLAVQCPDVRIGIVFWEDDPEVFASMKVTLIPAQIIFDAGGREVARHRGVWELEDMLEKISKVSE